MKYICVFSPCSAKNSLRKPSISVYVNKLRKEDNFTRIFLSVEAHISTAGIISDALKKIESAAGVLETTDYTESLDNITIIKQL